MKTSVEKGEYKGHATVSVWEVDPAGNKVGKYPIVSFGVGKAVAILKNVKEIKEAFNLSDADIAAD